MTCDVPPGRRTSRSPSAWGGLRRMERCWRSGWGSSGRWIDRRDKLGSHDDGRSRVPLADREDRLAGGGFVPGPGPLDTGEGERDETRCGPLALEDRVRATPERQRAR